MYDLQIFFIFPDCKMKTIFKFPLLLLEEHVLERSNIKNPDDTCLEAKAISVAVLIT